jgi:hypothetical protein
VNEIEAHIRQSAQARGIDPDVAVRVAMSEGGLKDPVRQSDFVKNGVREQSYGPFQLYMGGGLGNRALAAGIDPRDPEQWRAGIDFALDEAAKRGWGQWYGAARVGIGNHEGIGGATAKSQTTPYALKAGHPPNPQVGTGGYVAPGAPQKSVADALATSTAKTDQDKYGKAAGKALEGLAGMSAPVMGAGGNMPALPQMESYPTEAMPIVSGGVNRDAMAMLMARLNNNSLWG